MIKMSGANGNSGAIEIGQSEQELVGSKKQLNWKKIGLIGGVAFIIVIIIVSIVLISGGDDTNSGASSRKSFSVISLEDILEGRLSIRRFNGSWISDKELLYRNNEGIVIGYNIEKGKDRILLGNDNEKLAQGFNFDVSPDNKYLLIAREHQKLFRHSYVALYDIVDLETRTVIPVTINDTQLPLLLCQWSPINNSLIFVYLNNIYYKATPSIKEIQITDDGSKYIYNGIPDWVYEEEIFASNTALWFSPDGKKFAFVRFDDTLTNLMNIPFYGPPGAIEFQYPTGISIHYPKAGALNPSVKLFSVNLETIDKDTTKYEMIVPYELSTIEHLITSVSWSNNDNIILTWMNRVQNKSIIQNCQMSNCSIVAKLESKTGWVELFHPPLHNGDGSFMAIVASQFQGATAGDYRHLTTINRLTGESIAITKGKYVVQDLLKWDSISNTIFYMANTEQDSEVLHLYAVKAIANAEPECLTCNLSFENVKQTYYDVEFSKTGNYVVLTALGPNIPRIDIYSWHVTGNNEASLTWITEWETNNEIREILSEKASPNIVHHNIQLDSGFSAKVMLLLPPGADLTGNIKYPMLVDVYGGPDSNNVVDRWSMDWGSFLATNRSIIYAKIDGRGSGLRGDKLMHTIYRHLGTVEIEDQIQTTKKLKEKLPYISKNHTGIWGWSYGGYASAMALALDNESVFSCAASVAPVTDWTYYDSIYTERYMGLPTLNDNKDGYDRSRLSTLATHFKNKKYFLIHGTLDDNVHFQQSMALSRSLERNDIMFKQMSYPDEDHGLAGVRPHLYHTLGRFFGECFDKGDL